jgi:hypothetical protein
MRSIRILLTSSCLFASSTLALAAASQEEADRVKAALEKLLTATPGVVTVALAGDAYDLTLDASPLIAKANIAGTIATVLPLHVKLTPLGNGQWQVDQSEPLNFSVKNADVLSIEYKIENFSQTGVFDEALGGFASGSFEVKNYTVKQDVLDLTINTRSSTDTKVAMMKGSSKSAAGASGGVDTNGQYETTGLTSNVTFTPQGGAAPITFSYTAEAPLSTYSGTGLRNRELIALVSWFVAHPSEQEIKSGQQELKTLVKAAMPLWENLQGKGEAKNIKITSQFGDASIGSMNFIVDANGVTKDGKFREGVELKGVKLPTAILPPWSVNLIPSDTSFDFTVSGFDAATSLGMIIDAFDANATPPVPDSLKLQLLSATLPNGVLDVSLNPGQIVSPSYTLSYEGVLKVNPAGLPSGTAKLRMKGFDTTLQALQTAAASDPSVQQAIGPLMVAKGFAKVEGDELVWAIESNGQGSILVNGVDVTKM